MKEQVYKPAYMAMTFRQAYTDLFNLPKVRDGFFYLASDLFQKKITFFTKNICAN